MSANRPSGFLLLYALAWAGVTIAYVPLLTVILPQRLTYLTGAEDLRWLAYATFAGAIAASFANIGFGWASDITRNRRIWVATGLALTLALLLLIARIHDPVLLIAAIVAWQFALNMMLGPLGAWAGDCVPDAQKGVLGGLLAFAPAMGALAGALVTIPGLASSEGRITIIVILVAATVLPLLLFGKQATVPHFNALPAVEMRDGPPAEKTRTVSTMWLSRLAIQIAEAALFAYLLFYFRAVDPSLRDADVARLFSFILMIAAPLALLTGRWADRNARPIAPLIGSAALVALGLAIMAMAGEPAWALAGYILFGIGSTVFLALHASQTLRILPRPGRRGRDLGVFNLTNTVPSLIVPTLVLAIVPGFGYQPLLWLLAGLALCSSLLLLSLPKPPSRLQNSTIAATDSP